ncbi:hypothetical protein LCL96_15340 [Rossellomorea aquimaris]|uniref:hypothetical protein n=1 Tax=Rossellomorea aquimaris TaxID=189382 RepID=UPI001CD2BB07|nr:hypothetical protein [Rossellomorea aquimaris]MCA1060312.1 hypothetical protein [Rossellomorea aquimaris]
MKKLLSLFFAAVLFISLGSSATFAKENPHLKQMTVQEKKELKEDFVKIGITSETADKLVSKLEDGQTIDSRNPEKVDKVLDSMVVTPEEPVQRHEFEDGSVVELSLEIIKEDTPENITEALTLEKQNTLVSAASTASGAAMRLVNCTNTSYTSTCKSQVRYYDGILDISYYANFVINNNGYDRITKIYDEKKDGIGYTISTDQFEITKATETSGGVAHATYKNYFDSKLPFGPTYTKSLRLYVGKNTYYAKWF